VHYSSGEKEQTKMKSKATSRLSKSEEKSQQEKLSGSSHSFLFQLPKREKDCCNIIFAVLKSVREA